jgi:probable F420-dependent oxidoreductase
VVKLWLGTPFIPLPRLPELVLLAEFTGIEGICLPDHMCVPPSIESSYPYASGKAVTGDIPIETPFPDPLVLIASLGTLTTRLRFVTQVLLVPLRHPIALAKQVATVATLTNGRLDLGVGTGWMREEYAAMGVPFERRGRILDESLAIMKRLWTGETVGVHGDTYSFEPVAVRPTPPRPVPVLVGGESDAALRRAAAVGDGWIAVNPTIEELTELTRRLRAAREAAGTLERPFEVRTTLWGRVTPEKIRAAAELGVTALVVQPWQVVPKRGSIYDFSLDEVLVRLPEFVNEVDAALMEVGA